MKDKLDKLYICNKGLTFTYYKIGDMLIPQNTNIYTIDDFKDSIQFKDSKEARYFNLIYKLSTGLSSIQKYKSSPYYKEYLELLAKRNPEFLI